MDVYLSENDDGDVVYNTEKILSTELKKQCGFGKEGNKNFPGTVTALQMQTYLVITDFIRRKNKKGNEYGMAVSVMMCPEAVWGRDLVAKAYTESPAESWQKLFDHVKELYEDADDSDITKLIGKKPMG